MYFKLNSNTDLIQLICFDVDVLDADSFISITDVDTSFVIADDGRIGKLALTIVDNALENHA